MKKMLLIGVLLMTTVLMAPTFAEPATTNWVMMKGKITSYDGVPVAIGWCGVHAKVGEWAKVHAFWIPTIPSPPMGPPNTEFTFSFHMAKVNGTAELNPTEGVNLTITGLWDVFNVTFGYHGELRNSTTEVVAWNVPGKLNVTDNWTAFTIDIEGLALINGTVIFHREKSTPMPIGDVTGDPTIGPLGVPDRTIDIWDLVHVAKAYGSTPGNPLRPNYDFSVDFDFDFEIGLGELTTVAANLGTEY